MWVHRMVIEATRYTLLQVITMENDPGFTMIYPVNTATFHGEDVPRVRSAEIPRGAPKPFRRGVAGWVSVRCCSITPPKGTSTTGEHDFSPQPRILEHLILSRSSWYPYNQTLTWMVLERYTCIIWATFFFNRNGPRNKTNTIWVWNPLNK